MAHDDYYKRLDAESGKRLADASGAGRVAESCEGRYHQLASIVGHRVAAVMEAFVDSKIAHHELNENKA